MLRFPDTRAWLIDALHDLSDREYQVDSWVNRKPDPTTGQQSSMDYCVEMLFDDGPDYRNPKQAIGSVLYDEDEVRVVSSVMDALDAVLGPRGSRIRPQESMAKPEWDEVLKSARVAFDLLSAKDREIANRTSGQIASGA